MRIVCVMALTLGLSAGAGNAFAQQALKQEDHKAVYSVGWTGDWSRDEGMHAAGGTVGLEITPIENRLSIETSVSAIRAKGRTEMPVEVAFRKPWQLAPNLELMAGIAPEVIHRFGTDGETFGGMSFGGHVMVWPRRNIGWFAEGAYEVTFPREGKEKAVEFSAGLLIGR